MGNEDKSQKERCQSNPAAEKRIGNYDDKITSGRDLSSRPWAPPRGRFLPGLPPGDDSLRKRVRFRVGTSDLTDVAATKALEQITAFPDDTMLEHR
jgi:hypothetical protein